MRQSLLTTCNAQALFFFGNQVMPETAVPPKHHSHINHSPQPPREEFTLQPRSPLPALHATNSTGYTKRATEDGRPPQATAGRRLQDAPTATHCHVGHPASPGLGTLSPSSDTLRASHAGEVKACGRLTLAGRRDAAPQECRPLGAPRWPSEAARHQSWICK